jgi:hypothetical protein
VAVVIAHWRELVASAAAMSLLLGMRLAWRQSRTPPNTNDDLSWVRKGWRY